MKKKITIDGEDYLVEVESLNKNITDFAIGDIFEVPIGSFQPKKSIICIHQGSFFGISGVKNYLFGGLYDIPFRLYANGPMTREEVLGNLNGQKAVWIKNINVF